MMLEQEIEKYLSGQTLCNCDSVSYRNIKNLILGFAEPREKRIEELEKEKKDLEWQLQEVAKDNDNYQTDNERLEKKNAELRKVAEFQQSSNMSRHFENKKLKEGLAVGSTWNKHLNSLNKELEEERDKYRNMVFDKDEQLTNAKEIIKELLSSCFGYNSKTVNYEIKAEAERFLSEVEK